MKKTYIKRLSKIKDSLDASVNALTEIYDELQAEFDEKSETWQESEKGQEAQEELDAVEEWLGTISDAADAYSGDLTVE